MFVLRLRYVPGTTHDPRRSRQSSIYLSELEVGILAAVAFLRVSVPAVNDDRRSPNTPKVNFNTVRCFADPEQLRRAIGGGDGVVLRVDPFVRSHAGETKVGELHHPVPSEQNIACYWHFTVSIIYTNISTGYRRTLYVTMHVSLGVDKRQRVQDLQTYVLFLFQRRCAFFKKTGKIMWDILGDEVEFSRMGMQLQTGYYFKKLHNRRMTEVFQSCYFASVCLTTLSRK